MPTVTTPTGKVLEFPYTEAGMEAARQAEQQSYGGFLPETLYDLLRYGTLGAASAAATPIASGLAGIAGLPFGLDAAVNAQREVESLLMPPTPRTPAGQQLKSLVGQAIEPIGSAVGAAEEALGDFGNDLGGPLVGAIAKTLPTAIGVGLPYAPKGSMTNAVQAMMPSEMPQVKGFWDNVLPPLQLDAAPGKSMTKVQAKAAGYPEDQPWHPIGLEKKLRKPFGEFSREVVDDRVGLQPHREATPEEMFGSTLIPAVGDRTDIAKWLLSVGGRPLARPIELEGGHGFMRQGPQSIWASDLGVVTGLNNKVNQVLEAGGNPLLTFAPGSHKMTNFSVNMADATLEQMAGNVSKTAKTKFDQELRKIRPEWKGIDNPGSTQALNNNGELRHAFMQVAQKDDYKNRGFPDAAETRFALTDPDLMNVPLLHGAQTMSRPTGQNVVNPFKEHTTYNTQMGGDYFGGIAQGIPSEVLFPDFYAARRAAGDFAKVRLPVVLLEHAPAKSQPTVAGWRDAVGRPVQPR
jgi:hypothetical protein